MSPEIITIAVGLVILWLLLTWVFKVVKVSISTIFMIGLILIILQVAFGIKHQQLWQELTQLIQSLIKN